jgi:hypothetical protein
MWSLQTQASLREAQWSGHALIVTNNPKVGCDGIYERAGTANGAPYGKSSITGNVLFWYPPAREWRLSDSIDDAGSDACISRVPCDRETACVPEGAHTWQWANVDHWETATVSVARVSDSEARRQVEVRLFVQSRFFSDDSIPVRTRGCFFECSWW